MAAWFLGYFFQDHKVEEGAKSYHVDHIKLHIQRRTRQAAAMKSPPRRSLIKRRVGPLLDSNLHRISRKLHIHTPQIEPIVWRKCVTYRLLKSSMYLKIKAPQTRSVYPNEVLHLFSNFRTVWLVTTTIDPIFQQNLWLFKKLFLGTQIYLQKGYTDHNQDVTCCAQVRLD